MIQNNFLRNIYLCWELTLPSSATIAVFSISILNDCFIWSLLHYVSHMLSCPTCLLHDVLSCLMYFMPYVHLCPTCTLPHLLLCPTYLVLYVPRALHAFLSHVSRALRVILPHVPRALCLLVSHVPRATCTLIPFVPYIPSCFMSSFSLRTPSASYLSYSMC